MAVAKQHGGAVKPKFAGGKTGDLVLSSGDIVIIGGAGEARIISAKAIDPKNNPKALGVFIGHGFEAAPKKGEVILGHIARKGYAPLEGDVFVVEGPQTKIIGQTKMAKPKGGMNLGEVNVGHRVEVDQNTGEFILKKTSYRTSSAKLGEISAEPQSRGFTVQVDQKTGHIVVRKTKEATKAFSDTAGSFTIQAPAVAKGYTANWPRKFGTPPEIMTGTGKEVRRVLNSAPEARVIAVRIGNQNKEQAAAAEDVFARVAEYLPQLIEKGQEETIQKFVEAVMPRIALSETALAQARMLVQARSTILQSGDFIDSKEVSRLAGYSETNPSVYPNKWKGASKVFAISSENKDYFPFYALDAKNGYQPLAAMSEVLGIFGDSKDSWGVALWFASLNSFLDDERPQDIIAIDPDRVVAAAKDEMAGVEHG